MKTGYNHVTEQAAPYF